LTVFKQMDSTLIQIIREYEAYKEQLNERIQTESLTGFVLFMNRKLNTSERKGVDFGLESWENFDRQTLSEMVAAMIGKMGRYVDFYAKKSMPRTMLSSLEEFTYLIVLLSEKSLTKTELIQHNVHQTTTGTEIIKRLLSKGFIAQETDATDKRSVRVSLTDLGRAAVFSTASTTKHIARLVTNQLNDDELFFLVNVLTKLDLFHDKIFRENKQTDFELITEKYLDT